MRRFIVDSKNDNERLDKFLLNVELDLSRSQIQKLIEQKCVFCNGDSDIKKNLKLSTNDEIVVKIERTNLQQEQKIKPENIKLDIVYEDDDIIVVNKKKNMVVHSGAGNYSGTLVNALLYHTDKLSYLCGEDRPGIVHRLDKDTSGLLVVAKTDVAYQSLKEQLQNRTVNKIYNAIVLGGFTADEGIINSPIERDKKNRLKMAVSNSGRPAVTRYKVIEKIGQYSLLSVKIETGRTHQIRVHLKSINKPIVGDNVYGVKSDKYKELGQMLHSKTLGFIHPVTKKYMEFDTNLPEQFQRVLEEIRRKR